MIFLGFKNDGKAFFKLSRLWAMSLKSFRGKFRVFDTLSPAWHTVSFVSRHIELLKH